MEFGLGNTRSIQDTQHLEKTVEKKNPQTKENKPAVQTKADRFDPSPQLLAREKLNDVAQGSEQSMSLGSTDTENVELPDLRDFGMNPDEMAGAHEGLGSHRLFALLNEAFAEE